jgi:hypothetical protein
LVDLLIGIIDELFCQYFILLKKHFFLSNISTI